MALTLDEVRKIAALARLRFTPEEEESFTRQLGEIVDFVDQLRDFEVPSETASDRAADRALGDAGTGLAAAPEADDMVAECLPREVFVANAPATDDGFLVVPEVKAGADGDG